MLRTLSLSASLALTFAVAPVLADPSETVNRLAERYYQYMLTHHPEAPYFSGVEPPTHDGLTDISSEGITAAQEEEDAIFGEIEKIGSGALVGKPEWVTLALVRQALHAARIRRICRLELWQVNQMSGWQLDYSRLASLQPTGTPELRSQALARWAKFPAYIDQVTENLKAGLEAGYSAPKAVVKRVIDQLDGLLALEGRVSPFFAMAKETEDEGFAADLEKLITERIQPAVRRHRDYLADEYLTKAREELSVTANPDGAACYAASLEAYTTLDRSPRDVFELGGKTVAANRARVVELGQAAYGLNEFGEIMARVKADPTDRFESKEELLEFSREAVARAAAEMPNWVGDMPQQRVKVVPFPEHEEGTGRSAHYNAGNDERPGEYRIPLHEPEKQSKGNAEATAFHETWPGHHLQVAVSRKLEGLHPVTNLIWFSGPGEGWARYSESLAEEMGLYETVTGPIRRRAWPARGMVVDPGLHLFGWSREQVKEYMAEAGRFPDERLDDMVDRIAILPGQLTAYDSGGLEIMALRREAEDALGEAFDIREFHDRILEYGTIPLPALREHIERWIRSKQ
ncbi:MAG: DUF885 domain-containing protein [Xanthomonadales bacterium]|nr:DUF885 domain-containing protein [Xanthomonadales bacterium]